MDTPRGLLRPWSSPDACVVDGVNLPEVEHISPALRQVVLFDRAATAKDLGSILVLDKDGNIVLDSRTLAPRKVNLADHEFFRIHQIQANAGLFISAPWITSDGEYLISLSRRVTAPDGSFQGVVAGSMRLSYFHNLFRKLQLGPKDALALFNSDGAILMRAPFEIERIGQNIKDSVTFRYFPRSQSGSYTTRSLLDGVSRLYFFQQIGARPLIISQGLAIDDIYADWWQYARMIGVAMAALAVFSTILLLYLIAALRRRAAAENRLALLAAMDGLTSLSNRRHFDKVLASEWKRAQRAGAPLSLLMIDVDHFKSYNDTFGHQAGDAVLATVAACIANCARRASDLAARYGGEEFSVLLPDVELQSAWKVAQQIRDELALMRIRLPQLPTVSIGISCAIPQFPLSESDLVGAADQALYVAKHLGRDRAELGARLMVAQADKSAA